MRRWVICLALAVTATAQAAPFAYIPGSGFSASVLTVIDTATDAVVTSLPILRFAQGAAVTSDGKTVYISSIAEDGVAVLDAFTNTISGSVALTPFPGGSPATIAVNSAGTRLYAAAGAARVTVVDLTTNTVIADLGAPGVIDNPSGVTVTPNGAKAYATNVFSGANVVAIDTATNTIVQTLPNTGSRGMDAHPDSSKVYAADTEGFPTGVSVIDTATDTLITKIPMFPAPLAVRVHPDGTRLYAAGNGFVALIDTVTNMVTTTVPTGALHFGVDINPSGTKIYLPDLGSAVQVRDADTLALITTIPVAGEAFARGRFIGPAFTCGNNVRDPGEVCDGTPCCTPTCTGDAGAPCNDGDGCTNDDACTASATCAGTPVDCDDGDTCTADLCNPFTQACSHVSSPKALGGDDSGCIPPDKATAKCEDGVTKNASKLALAVFKCNVKASSAGLKATPFDEVACQNAAITKYDLKTAALQACPGCLDRSEVRTAVLTQTDGLAAQAIYCDSTSGTPLGAGGGFVPNNKAIAKCEDGATKALAKLMGAVVKCHTKLADAKFKAKPFDEEACETTAVGKFDVARLKLTDCPACLAPLLPGLGTATAAGVDGQNAQTYCASPSGAFVGGE